MTKTAQTSVGPFVPTQVAADAGAAGSAWFKLGDGPWHGTVKCPGGSELSVEETPSGWNVTDDSGRKTAASGSTGAQLEQLLRRVIAART